MNVSESESLTKEVGGLLDASESSAEENCWDYKDGEVRQLPYNRHLH
jgi:hypothetical protein